MHPESVHQAQALRTEAEPAGHERARAPKARPILFSGAMVRALLACTKTQTRRVIKDQQIGERFCEMRPEGAYLEWLGTPCCGTGVWDVPEYSGIAKVPCGTPGDRLWVREAWRADAAYDAMPPRDIPAGSQVWYEADTGLPGLRGLVRQGKLRPGMFMPRWASRITLEVTGVRVERLHDISEADARAEGIVPFGDGNGWHTEDGRHYAGTAVEAYFNLWADINGTASAEANPFVWAISFRQAASVN